MPISYHTIDVNLAAHLLSDDEEVFRQKVGIGKKRYAVHVYKIAEVYGMRKTFQIMGEAGQGPKIAAIYCAALSEALFLKYPTIPTQRSAMPVVMMAMAKLLKYSLTWVDADEDHVTEQLLSAYETLKVSPLPDVKDFLYLITSLYNAVQLCENRKNRSNDSDGISAKDAINDLFNYLDDNDAEKRWVDIMKAMG